MFSIMVPVRTHICFVVMVLIGMHHLVAQTTLPSSSGFGGYFLFGPGYFSVKSNLLVTGPPLTGDVGKPTIPSIFASPDSNGSFALPVAGELNYTFSKTKTQLFFGNGLEDILRLDVPVGIGIRQQFRDSSRIMIRYLGTPLKLKFWEDPYIEDELRQETKLNFQGVRFRWFRMFRSKFEFTANIRKYKFENESSGDWLIDQARLDPADQPLLNRDGYVYRFELLHQFNLDQQNMLRPAIQYINDDHKGNAIANQGFGLKLNYLKVTPKYIFDANILFGKRFSSEDHPVYEERIDAFRFGATMAAFIPIKLFDSNRWNIWITGDYILEQSKIDFFDSRLLGIMGGLMYRANRK